MNSAMKKPFIIEINGLSINCKIKNYLNTDTYPSFLIGSPTAPEALMI